MMHSKGNVIYCKLKKRADLHVKLSRHLEVQLNKLIDIMNSVVIYILYNIEILEMYFLLHRISICAYYRPEIYFDTKNRPPRKKKV